MLRDIEGLSTSETAEGLGLGEEAVKTRLHRARAMLRRSVTDRLGAAASAAFQFHAPRCDRVVAAVLKRLAELDGPGSSESRPNGINGLCRKSGTIKVRFSLFRVRFSVLHPDDGRATLAMFFSRNSL
jgi:hypothetical protein